MGRALIKCQYGAYKGTVEVEADNNDDNEVLFARARRKADLTFLTMAYESYKVVWRDYD